MGTCVSRCFPCSSDPPSTAGDHSLSCGGSSTLSRHQSGKHVVAVHPLPIASNSPTPIGIAASTSTSSSLLSAASSSLLSAASSSASMATTSSSTAATRPSSSSSSSSSRPFSPEFLKVRTCRDMDMEVVVLDAGKKKKKLSQPASAAPRQSSSPRTPPALSVVKSPRKKKPSTSASSNSNGRRIRTTTPTTMSARRVRPLPPRAPPAGAGARAGAGRSASCRKDRLSSSSYSCRSADSGGRRKSTGATVATAGIGVGGGELVDDLNNPLMSMDCFIFL